MNNKHGKYLLIKDFTTDRILMSMNASYQKRFMQVLHEQI